MNMTIKEFCRKHEACKEGLNWAVENCKDMGEVWLKAKPEWLMWIATRNGVLTDQELRLFAIWCARQVQHLMTDKRSIAMIDVGERYANGNATLKELKEAWRAAREVVRDASNLSEAALAAFKSASVVALRADGGASVVAIEAAWGAREAVWEEAWRVSWDARKVPWGARKAAREATKVARDAQAQYLRQNCKPNFER